MSGTFHKPTEEDHLKVNSIHNYYMNCHLNRSAIDELGEWCLTNEGGATRQTEPNAQGIHGNQPAATTGRPHTEKTVKTN